MGMRWNKAATVTFVRIYGKYECLWNYDHPGYRDLELKTKAYCDIVEEFHAATSISMSIPECKVKVRNLRTTYLQQLKLIKRRSRPGETYVPRLAWFNEMDRFLKHIPVHSRETQETSSDVDSSVCPEDNENGSRRNPLSGQDDDSSHEETVIKQESSPSPRPCKKNKKKKIKMRAWTTEVARPAESPCRVSTEDEFDIYGKYIASQLRSMDLQKALKVQLSIQSLMSEARIDME